MIIQQSSMPDLLNLSNTIAAAHKHAASSGDSLHSHYFHLYWYQAPLVLLLGVSLLWQLVSK